MSVVVQFRSRAVARSRVARWHVTVLSNFAVAYDKYQRVYAKTALAQSTFPSQFFVLERHELGIGVAKASAHMQRLGLAGNRLLALGTDVAPAELHANTATGRGHYVKRNYIVVERLAWVDVVDGEVVLTPVAVEDVYAQSLQLLHPALLPYAALAPRSFSILPIARGCQAACPFCFSEASASAEQDQRKLDLAAVQRNANAAKARGAQRFVITGGGEPGLLRHATLCSLIGVGARTFDKTVLISNGHHLGSVDETTRANMLADYAAAGLGVLAISRHHYDDARAAALMSLHTDVAAIAATWRAGTAREWSERANSRSGAPQRKLKLRLICVLQAGCIDNAAALADYISWAVALGVEEICFKELYVSTSVESVYYRHDANAWSHAHQVPLRLVTQFASDHGFAEVARLPWGAPVFRGTWQGATVQLAAYTEPSLYWERCTGVARSWNMMADGQCLVSLEDRHSAVAEAL